MTEEFVAVGMDVGIETATVVLAMVDGDVRRVLEVVTLKAPLPNFYALEIPGGTRFIFALDRIALEQELRRRHMSEEIIERILRLNPKINSGRLLRGWHYKLGSRWGMSRGWLIQKGHVLSAFGPKVWSKIPRSAYVKDGRRIYVGRSDLEAAVRATT